jgi:hypothetical protein
MTSSAWTPVTACSSTTIRSWCWPPMQLGYHGVALVRGVASAPSSVPVITSLDEVPSIVNGSHVQ